MQAASAALASFRFATDRPERQIELRLRGLDSFPERKPERPQQSLPQVLFLDVADGPGRDTLEDLASQLRAHIAACGLW